MRFSTTFFVLASLGLSTVVFASACSSSSSSSSDSGCAGNPFTCSAGQTCSVKDTSGTFACLAAGKGAKGDACQNTVGVAQCGDNLVCLQLTTAGGSCVAYCDPSNAAHGCATGETCREAALQGTTSTFFVCVGGTTPPADAGHD